MACKWAMRIDAAKVSITASAEVATRLKPITLELPDLVAEAGELQASVAEDFDPIMAAKVTARLTGLTDILKKVTGLFDTSFNFSNLSEKEKFAKFKYQIRKFVTEQVKVIRELSEKEVEDVIFFFGSMISHVHMRRGITISKLRTQVNFVHKCLYNYSHKKLSQLMSQEGFKHVLEDFVHNGGFEIVLNSEETMMKHQDAYKEAVNALLLKCQE